MSATLAELGFVVRTDGIDKADKALVRLDKTGKVVGSTGEKTGGQIDRSMRNATGGIATTTGGFNLMGAALKGIGLIAASAGIAALARDSVAFGSKLSEVSTLVDTSVISMKDLSDEAVRMAGEFGSSPIEQTKAFYQAISAGALTGADGVDRLRNATELMDVANKLAVGGATDVTTAVDGLTTIMNAYGDEAGSAMDVSDAMFVAMKAGKTTIAELAGAVGTLAPIASQAGMSVEELLAATAALTKGGIVTTTSMNGLKAILSAVVKPSEEAAKMAKRLADENKGLGFEFSAAGLKAEGFAAFMEKVRIATGGSTEKMAVLFGGVEALGPALALTGGAADDFGKVLVAMTERSGETQAAFDKVMGTFGAQSAVLIGTIKAEFIGLGAGILEKLVPAMKWLVQNVGPAFDALGKGLDIISKGYSALTTAIGTSAVFIGLSGALESVAKFLTPLLPAIKDFGGAAAVVIGTIVGLNAVMALAAGAIGAVGAAFKLMGAIALANPITLAVAAIAASVYMIYKNWDALKAWWSALWVDLKGKASTFVNWWQGTSFEGKALALDIAVLALARKAADTFFRWWDNSTLKEHAPKIVLDAVEKARTLSETFFNWWAANDFKTKVIAITTAPVTAAKTLAETFFAWWKSTPIEARELAIDTAAMNTARVAVAGFAGWWNNLPFIPQELQISTKSVDTASQVIGKFMADVAKGWSVMIDKIAASDVVGKLGSMWDGLVVSADAVWEKIVAGAANVLPDISAGFSIAFADVGEILGEVKTLFTGFWNDLLVIGNAFFPDFIGKTSLGWSGVIAVFSGVWTVIVTAVKSGWDLVTGVLVGGLQILQGDFSKGWETIAETVSELGTNLMEGAKKLWPDMLVIGKEIIDFIRVGFVSGFQYIGTATVALGKYIFDKLKSIPKKVFEVGKDVAIGLGDGMWAWAKGVAQKAGQMAGVIKPAIQDEVESHSRSEMTFRIGKDVAQGLADGLEAGMSMVGYAARQLADHAAGFFTGFYDSIVESISSGGSLKSVFSDMGDYMVNWLRKYIAHFAANKIMVVLGMDSSGTSTGGLSSITDMFSSASSSGSTFSSMLSTVGTRFVEGRGAATGFDGVMSGLSGVFTGSSAGATSAAQSFGVLASNANTATGLMGGLSAATTGAGTAAASTGSSYGVLMADMNAASATMGSTALTALGAAAAYGYLGYMLGEALGAANSMAVGIGAAIGAAIGSIVPIIGTALGAAIGGAIGSAFGGAWQAVTQGFDLVFKDGDLSGHSRIYMERERSMWRGTARSIIYSELNEGVAFAVNKFFTDLAGDTVALANQLGIAGANSIMEGYAAQAVVTKGNAEQIGEQMAEYFDNATRDAYLTLFYGLGPALQTAIVRSVDLVNGDLEVIAARFTEIASVTTQLIPLLGAMGVTLGDTADEAQANGLAMSDSLGGASNALAIFTQFALEFAPAGTLAALQLEQATDQLENWNRSMGLGFTQTGWTNDAFDRLVGKIDLTTQAGQSLSIGLDAWSTGIVDSTGSLHLNVDAFRRWLEGQSRQTEAQQIAYELGMDIADMYERMQLTATQAQGSLSGYAGEIDRTTEAGTIAAEQIGYFVTGIGDADSALTLNVAGLELYMTSLDRTTVAGEAAWQSANDLAEAFGVNSEGAIVTSDALYALAVEQMNLGEAGQELALITIQQADALKLVEENNRVLLATMFAVNDASTLLNLNFDKTSPAAIEMANGLVQLMGGMEAFNSATEKYYQNFYSQEERTQLALMQSAASVSVWQDSLSDAQLQLAGITDGTVDTKEEFRLLVESLDTLTPAGALLTAQTLGVQDAFLAVLASEQSVAEIFDALPDNLKETFNEMLADAGLTAQMLEDEAGNIWSTIEGVGQSLSLMDIMFIELNGTLVESAAGVDGATYQIGESLYTITTNAEGMKTLVVSSVNDMVAEVGTATGGMVETTATDVLEMSGQWSSSLETLLENTDISGTSLVETVQSAFTTLLENTDSSGTSLIETVQATFTDIISNSGESGDTLVAELDAAFTDVLREAGILRTDLPAELQAGFNDVIQDASTTANALVSSSVTGRDAMVALGDKVVGLGGLARNTVTPIGQAGSALTGLAGAARSSATSMAKSISMIGGFFRVAKDAAAAATTAASSAASSNSIISNLASSLSIDGSNAGGLDRVPYNGYVSELHLDEMVPNALVSNELRSMGVTATSIPESLRQASNQPSASGTPAASVAPTNNAVVAEELRKIRKELEDTRQDNASEARTASKERRILVASTGDQTTVLKTSIRENDRTLRKVANSL